MDDTILSLLFRQFAGSDERPGMLAVLRIGDREGIRVRPERVRRGEARVIGIQAQTSAALEADPATAAVPGLWRRFAREGLDGRIPNRAGTLTTCAVYSGYQGQDRDGYRCLVGVEVTSLDQVPEGMVGLVVPAGAYLVFAARGQMPGALAATWDRVGAFFEHAQVGRAWTADLEVHYPGGSAVDVCVAVLDRGRARP
jgi:predicted transcriptional regulator YdeE